MNKNRIYFTYKGLSTHLYCVLTLKLAVSLVVILYVLHSFFCILFLCNCHSLIPLPFSLSPFFTRVIYSALYDNSHTPDMQSSILLFLIREQARTRCSVKHSIQHQTTVLKPRRKSNNTPLLWSMVQGLATWSKETNVNSVIFLYKTYPYSTPLLEKNKGKNLCLANSKGDFSNFAQSLFGPFWVIYLCFGFLFGAKSLIFAVANNQFST